MCAIVVAPGCMSTFQEGTWAHDRGHDCWLPFTIKFKVLCSWAHRLADLSWLTPKCGSRKESTTNLALPLVPFVSWGLLSVMYREQASLVSACSIPSLQSHPVQQRLQLRWQLPLTASLRHTAYCCEFSVPCDCSQETTAAGLCSTDVIRFRLWCGHALHLQRTARQHFDRKCDSCVTTPNTTPSRTVQKTVEALQTHLLVPVLGAAAVGCAADSVVFFSEVDVVQERVCLNVDSEWYMTGQFSCGQHLELICLV